MKKLLQISVLFVFGFVLLLPHMTNAAPKTISNYAKLLTSKNLTKQYNDLVASRDRLISFQENLKDGQKKGISINVREYRQLIEMKLKTSDLIHINSISPESAIKSISLYVTKVNTYELPNLLKQINSYK